ncbi:MAG: DedA family protein [Sedimentisphaerales bacterium]
MEIINHLIDFILHLDKHLNYIIESSGLWCYLIFFVIIFAETGLVVTPFLPGDSLLFTLGTLAAAGSLKVSWLFVVLAAAAILGDSANYAVGKYFGQVILRREGAWFLKKEHIERTHKFYEKYGAKTIVIARFVPIVRTFAPFIAGVGKMTYLRFFSYNVVGGVLWVALFVFGGFFFGNIPVIKRNFTLVIFAIIIISILPAVIEVIREKRRSKKGVIMANANEQVQRVIVVSAPKSIGIAIILTVLFGPLGMFYSTIIGAIIMTIISLIVAILTAGLGWFLTLPVCVIWGALAANAHNKKNESRTF